MGIFQKEKKVCPQNHPYSGDNLYIYNDRRYCKTCRSERQNKYVSLNREKVNLWNKKWIKNNPEKAKAFDNATRQNRRAQKLQSGGFINAAQWKNICEEYSNLCLCCKKNKKLTMDHIIPLSKGGTHTINNIQPLCGSCNSKKGTKIIDYRANGMI